MILVVDTETGGLQPQQAAIWDIAACAVDGGRIVSEFSSLVWPGRDYLQPEHRDVIESISCFDVRALLNRDVPEASEVSFNLWHWVLETISETGLPVQATSFNAPFDRGFLESEPWDWNILRENGALAWAPCVMLAAHEQMEKAGALEYSPRYGRTKWPKLSDACRYFGVPFEETHRALGDARAAAQLAIKLGLDLEPAYA